MIMERKLELRDISGYLPYKIHFINPEFGDPDSLDVESLEVIGMPDLNHFLLDELEDEPHITEVKLVLRPLSDLYQTITHNGKEIIPIVELACKENLNVDWRVDYDVCQAETDGIRFVFKIEDFILFIEEYEKNIFDQELNSDMYNANISQIQLFDYLHELKIDFRGLIDAGLAVSVHDLKENPYK